MREGSPVEFDSYDAARDHDHAHRIWSECGWLDLENAHQKEGVDALIDAGRAWVARMDGEAECMVLMSTGQLQYLDTLIPFSGVMAVTTSRVARKQSLAGRLTAQAVAYDVENGALVSGLGMFEQGFYNRLGFGTGHCEHQIGFDPQRLTVPFQKRPPKRLTKNDFAAMHASRLANTRHHGYVVFESPLVTKMDQCNTLCGFGLGYFDDAGNLTHHVWFSSEDPHNENGPYHVKWMTFQNRDQFMELMGVIRSLGDQIRLVTMILPNHIQMQDLLEEPIQNRMTTHGGKLETFARSLAWWQNRMNDIPGCLALTSIPGETVRFNLQVTDPIERYLDDTCKWRGVEGEYIVTLGPESSAVTGCDASLETLKTTVNAFTRAWLGNVSPSGLHYTDEFDAPESLLRQLDRVLRLPLPGREWDF